MGPGGQAVYDHFVGWVFINLPESVFGGTLCGFCFRNEGKREEG